MYVILNPDSSFYRRIQSIIQDINNVIDVNVILNPDSSSHWQIQSIIPRYKQRADRNPSQDLQVLWARPNLIDMEMKTIN